METFVHPCQDRINLAFHRSFLKPCPDSSGSNNWNDMAQQSPNMMTWPMKGETRHLGASIVSEERQERFLVSGASKNVAPQSLLKCKPSALSPLPTKMSNNSAAKLDRATESLSTATPPHFTPLGLHGAQARASPVRPDHATLGIPSPARAPATAAAEAGGRLGVVDVQFVYNTIVDSMVGHVLVDTRQNPPPRACVRACVRACARACVRTCVCACARTHAKQTRICSSAGGRVQPLGGPSRCAVITGVTGFAARRSSAPHPPSLPSFPRPS
jgi:hypothetical protein